MSRRRQRKRPKAKGLRDQALSLKSDAESLSCTFVDPIPEEIQTECAICLQTLTQPYIVGCCGNRFCKTCIEPSAVTIRSCPLCKKYNFKKLPDKHLERVLNQRRIYCLLQDEGCSWIGKLGELQDHLCLDNHDTSFSFRISANKCQYVPIQCPHCNTYMLRSGMEEHKGTCLLRPAICKYNCGHKCPFKDIVTHLKKCPRRPDPCPNHCHHEIASQDLERHLANDCPLQMVDCDYSYAGCKEIAPRALMEDHIQKKLREHLNLVSRKCKELIAEKERTASELRSSKTLKAEVVTLNRKIAAMSVAKEDQQSFMKRKIISHLMVRNLPDEADDQKIRSIFGRYGTMEEVTFLKFGAVRFLDQSSYHRLMQTDLLRGIKLLQHKLELELVYF